MIYKEFIDEIKDAIVSEFGYEYDVRIEYSRKLNNMTGTGLVIKKTDLPYAPVIYLDFYFEEYIHGASIQDIKTEIVAKYYEAEIKEPIDLTFFLSFENVKDHIYCKIVNYQENYELLQTVPYMQFLDLALICYYQMPDESKISGTVLIQNKLLYLWDISVNELIRIAKENTYLDHPYQCNTMEELLAALMREQTEMTEIHSNMYVLSSPSHFYGAVYMAYIQILSEIGDMLSCDYYVLPSSIHECIIIPDFEEVDCHDLKEMVTCINAEYVAADERLSDNIYYYRRDTSELNMVDFGSVYLH